MARYDLIAVGGGTAGLVASAGAAGLGARAAVIEHARLGGECLWNGCVPSKALLACARAAYHVRQAAVRGVDARLAGVEFARVMAWVRDAQRRIEPHDSAERYRSLGVDVVQGTARFTGARTLQVDGREISGRHIVIATGSKPRIPALPGIANVPYLTNETVFDLDELPASMIVLGGGPIGLEMALAFARLGSAVCVVETSRELLPREDHEVAALLTATLRSEGVQLALGVTATGVARDGAAIVLRGRAADGREFETRGDELLIATGRQANVETLALAVAGVETGREGVIVDGRLRTTARGVWAAGDVSGGLRFTHVADYEARLVVRNALFPLAARVSYSAVPWVTYTDPELAHVGITEREARERHGGAVRVWRRPFADVDRAIADGERAGMVKLITTARGRVLGGHVLGHRAGDMIGEITLAMRHGLSASQLASTIHPYPTYAEAIKQSADAFMRAKLTGAAKQIARWLVRR